MGLLTKIFGTASQREIKKIQPTVDKILAMEEEYKALSEEALKAKTQEFKDRLSAGETLDDILPEAFAAIREAADRVLGMRPYPVQLIGGIVLHQGRIAEMKTGEGKTLVAILPCYLNALTGNGVHVVTVNDYLAKRDSEWMGKVHRYMGLTVGLVIPGMKPGAIKDAKIDENALAHTEAIIKSMTKKEREHPEIIQASRKIRIAKGSGTSVEEVNKLLKQFDQMKKMIKQFSGAGGRKNPFGKMKIPF